MMAFLLDIITFLQISFSTNIFRINYIRSTSLNTIKILFKI
ncbi:rRNA methyltransferase [Francisella tularensis]|nr:rRNA methyltransferase [Francisella tularensis]PNM28720.1 rRNA methyltransferase [Francisella tularensis]ROZ68145.1 rRNA methyltransferase [Francisella tularensis]ROZ71126.1 rRNA methyltransferase [Francisella tularensis]ROZ72961.1 rRNA methyltransferase [Francisella tularensis]